MARARDAELTLFMGKGGVGKTTVSAAYAAWLARTRRSARVLLLSTDPAHSLGDVLERKIGAQPVAIAPRLQALEVHAEQRFRAFLDQYRRPLMEIMEAGTMFSAEEIEPLLESTLPGMAEISALLAIHDALTSGKYTHVVVDTAPFGHTLRLLQMPEAFARLLRFLELAAARDAVLAAHFGGRAQANTPPLIATWRELAEQLVDTLRERARLALVAAPEKFSLNESVRVAKQMHPLKFQQVILNRVVRPHRGCARCSSRTRDAAAARRFLKKNFPGAALREGEDPGFPIIGVEALRQFGAHVFSGREQRLKPPVTLPTGTAEATPRRRVPWPVIAKPLALTLGKGGVGKTTISAALAWRMRHAKKDSPPVTVCSTDPAPSLDDIFQTAVGDEMRSVPGDPQLRAIEIDAAAEFQRWAAAMKARLRAATSAQSGGVHVDLSFERELFESLLDIVPPGVDEIFGVLRTSGMLGRGARVILDMAPTGHALELLRTPERMLHWSRLLLKTLAQHRTLPLARDLGAEIALIARKVRELAATLRDARATVAHVVVLAEPLPDRETARLVRQLQGLGLRPAALWVNRVLFAEDVEACAWCRSRRAWQQRSLQRLSTHLAPRRTPLYVVREREHGPSGAKELTAFTRELWKLE